MFQYGVLWGIRLVAVLLLCVACRRGGQDKAAGSRPEPAYSVAALMLRYGAPVDREQYLITEEADEFRTLVLDCFPDSVREQRSVCVWEYTWCTNAADSLLTVWYLPTNDSLDYLCHFEHSTHNLY